MENEMVRRLVYSGLVAATGALAAIVSRRIADQIWRMAFHDEPPSD